MSTTPELYEHINVTKVREIIAKAHVEAVEGFSAAVKQAGQSTADKKGLWERP